MPNAKAIYTCEVCGQLYCGECTEVDEGWDRFCSDQCKNQQETENPSDDDSNP